MSRIEQRHIGELVTHSVDGTEYILGRVQRVESWNSNTGGGSCGGTLTLSYPGGKVGRVAKGKYVLFLDGDEIELFSDEPDAP